MNIIKVPYDIYRKAEIGEKWNIHSFSDFIFHDFKIVFDDESYEHKGIDEEYIIHFEPSEKIFIVENKDYVGCDPTEYYYAKAQWVYFEDIARGDAFMLPECRSDKYPNESDEVARSVCRIALWYMGWIMDKSQKRERNYKVVQRKYKYSREHRLSTSNNKIWLLDDIVHYASDNYIPEKSHHSINCPCWEVRGHYRHYKSGKVVFIPSYCKGKQRDTAKPKDKEYYA
ncbi:MAG: hypothetical protein IKE92_11385 [Clostridiales bacterium]|nr:hypothetical protein [Clostridiales bacterium]